MFCGVSLSVANNCHRIPTAPTFPRSSSGTHNGGIRGRGGFARRWLDENVRRASPLHATDTDVFVLTGKDCEGRGQLVEDGFTVFAGSKGRKQVVPSAGKWVQTTREELLASGVLAEDGAQLVFKEDHTFKTPSGAGMPLMGRSANGWMEWESKFGGTLDELKRQQPYVADESTETRAG